MAKPNQLVSGDGVQESDLPTQDVILHDPENPRAITSLVPDAVKGAIMNVVREHPDYLEMTEHELRDLVRPSDALSTLRVAFWHEYSRAQDSGQKMNMARVYGGVVSHTLFYGKLLSRPLNVAWLICSPANYLLTLESALNKGMSNLSKLMEMAVVDDMGQVIPKNAAMFLKAFELLNDRVKGAVVQKIEQKTAALHMHRKDDSASVPNMDNLRDELEKLRGASRLTQEITARNVDEATVVDEA